MTVGIATSQANSLLDTLLTTNFIQLHTGDPAAAGTTLPTTGTVGGSRQAATFAAASGGSKSLSASPQWVAWDGGPVTVTHLSIWTASTAGTFKESVALTTGKAVTNGDTLTLNTLVASLSPLAA